MFRSIAPLAAAMLVFAAGESAAQTAPVDASPFFSVLQAGVGARAWGMGGAQIALPDSAEASSWNPAAAAGLSRPAAFGVFTWDHLTGDYETVSYALSTGHTGSITPERVAASATRLQALGFACPFKVAGRQLVAGVAYRRRLALPGTSDAAYRFRSQSAYRFDYDYRYKASGTGGFDTIGVSIATDLGRGIRAGAAVHRWFGTLSSSYVESYRYSVSNYYGWSGSWSESLGDDVKIEVSGLSVDIGAQFASRDKYFAGVVYRSGTSADVAYSNTATFEDTHTARTALADYSGRGALSLPSAIGFGFAVRPIPRLTLAVDQSWVFWSDAVLDDYARVNALGGVPQPARVAFPTEAPADLHKQSDTGRISVGCEFITTAGQARIPLRAGLAYQQPYDRAGSSGVAVSVGGGVRWRGLFVDAAWVRETAPGRYTRQSLTSTVGWTF